MRERVSHSAGGTVIAGLRSAAVVVVIAYLLAFAGLLLAGLSHGRGLIDALQHALFMTWYLFLTPLYFLTTGHVPPAIH